MPVTASRWWRGGCAALLLCVLPACGGSGGSGPTGPSGSNASTGTAGNFNNDPSSPNSPPNPANTNLSGTWTGTLTRPSGLSPISIRWVGTQDNRGSLSGPFSMTFNGVTIDATFDGSFSGGTSQAASISFRVFLTTGASSVSPTCNIVSNGTMTTFTAKSLTSAPFNVSYTSCKGFIENDAQRTQHVDTDSVLTLTKQ